MTRKERTTYFVLKDFWINFLNIDTQKKISPKISISVYISEIFYF